MMDYLHQVMHAARSLDHLPLDQLGNCSVIEWNTGFEVEEDCGDLWSA